MLIARDGGCTKPCCAVPAYGAQVHHALNDWADGGNTNVNDMTLACGPDNRLVDKDNGWTTTINDRGDVEWAPPPHLDTGQTRINYYHRPELLLRPPERTRRKPRTRTIIRDQPPQPPNRAARARRSTLPIPRRGISSTTWISRGAAVTSRVVATYARMSASVGTALPGVTTTAATTR